MSLRRWIAGAGAVVVAVAGLGAVEVVSGRTETAQASTLVAPAEFIPAELAAALGTGSLAAQTGAGVLGTSAVSVPVVGGLGVAAAGLGIGFAIGSAGVTGYRIASDAWGEYTRPSVSTDTCPGFVKDDGIDVPEYHVTANFRDSKSLRCGQAAISWEQWWPGNPDGNPISSTYSDGTVLEEPAYTGPGGGYISLGSALDKASMEGNTYSYDGTKHLVSANIYGIASIQAGSIAPARRLTAQWSCQHADASITTNRSYGRWVSYLDSLRNQELPEITCPSGSHVVKVLLSVAGKNGAADEALSNWSPASDFTDPASPWARCLALAGSQLCWVNHTPATDTTPESCMWGPFHLAPDCSGLPSPTPTAGGGGDGGDDENPPSQSGSCDFAPGDADTHYDKHVRGLDDNGNPTLTPDMPEYDHDEGFEQYVQDAQDLLCGDQGGNLHYGRDSDEAVLRMDPQGRIGIVDGNRITTFFRPDNPANYWLRQTGQNPPSGFFH